MSQLPPPLPGGEVNYQSMRLVDRDEEHLRILSIFWYVFSGLMALFGTFPIIHLTLGLVMLLSPGTFGAGRGGPPPAFVGWMFTCIGGSFVCFGWGSAVLAFVAARSMRRRRRMVLCQIAAGVACLQIPLGTVLGVFTFVVLGRESVKQGFG